MFGGVAQKYALYTLVGEPFKEGKYYYILAKAPFSKTDPIKVRFYTDKTHAAIKSDPYNKPLWEIFGFKDENSSILMIKEKDLSKDELENLFYYNWKKGGKWKAIDLYGGAWYAPLDAVIPPISHKEKIFECSWTTFKAQNKRRCLIMGASKDCVWLKED